MKNIFDTYNVQFKIKKIKYKNPKNNFCIITAKIEKYARVDEVEEIQQVAVSLADKPREYVNFIGIERVGQDSRLAWIAYKYYAQKDLWVFIYEANRDIIKDPTHVRPGQYIRIPELSEEYRNLYNPELKQLVDSLAIEYLSNKK